MTADENLACKHYPKEKILFVVDLSACTPGGDHVFEFLVDIGAILFKDHDTERTVVGGDT